MTRPALAGWASALLLALGPFLASPARADFRICNQTGSRLGVAIGYNDGQGWVTEGWFTLGSNRCDSFLKGDLSASYYYVHAIDYDRGGEWGGASTMCTREREFTIRGSENCLARGYDRSSFLEINTGQQRSWTLELQDDGRTTGGAP